MNKEELLLLYELLSRLMMEAPCKGGRCAGHQNCEFGENDCYGERCAIEDVQAEVDSMIRKKKD